MVKLKISVVFIVFLAFTFLQSANATILSVQRERLNEISQEKDKLAREYKQADDQVKAAEREDEEFSDLEITSDCSEACRPVPCGCNPKIISIVFGKEILAPLTEEENNSNICERIWDKFGSIEKIKRVSRDCVDAVKNCSTVRKKIALAELKARRDEIKKQLDEQNAEYREQNKVILDTIRQCPTCAMQRDPSTAEIVLSSVLGGLQAITPGVLGALGTYNYIQTLNTAQKNYNCYLAKYNDFLGQCSTLGVPCPGPNDPFGRPAGLENMYGGYNGYGGGPGFYANMGTGWGYNGFPGYGGYTEMQNWGYNGFPGYGPFAGQIAGNNFGGYSGFGPPIMYDGFSGPSGGMPGAFGGAGGSWSGGFNGAGSYGNYSPQYTDIMLAQQQMFQAYQRYQQASVGWWNGGYGYGGSGFGGY